MQHRVVCDRAARDVEARTRRIEAVRTAVPGDPVVAARTRRRVVREQAVAETERVTDVGLALVGLAVGGTLKLAGEATGVTTIEGAAKRTADQISEQLMDAAKRQGWL